MEIEKPEFGFGELYVEKKLEVYEEGEKVYENDSYSLHIPEASISPDQEEEYIAKAIVEINETFYPDGDLSAICGDIFPNQEYADGKVSAEWRFDSYEWISPEGKYLCTSNNKPDGSSQKVNAEVTLTCGTSSRLYSFPFVVKAKEENFKESLEKALNQTIADCETNTVMLPETVSINGKEYSLKWEDRDAFNPFYIVVAAVFLVILIKYELKEKTKRKTQKKRRTLELEYPEMVSEYAVLVGAGMSVRNALDRIIANREKKNVTGTELTTTLNEIENGVSEYTAFVNLGERCAIRQYRRFSSLITQNIRHGRALATLLNQEAERAYDERKNMAKKLGEEAGTKMMIPMFMMLIIIMVITVYPAFINMNI
ncbi:MAG: type II secretion system F family protein [Lachnospiraceae bacterium]|nr:type II secretion system F family protein [Lachnospiraceae bacterium]